MYTERDNFLKEILPNRIRSDFSTWGGFGELWEWSAKQDWWEDFLISLTIIKEYEGHLVDMMAIYSPEEFADAIYVFLKNRYI